MDALMTRLRATRASRETKLLTVVAVSEDHATELRVQEFCRDLARVLEPGCELTQQVWLTSELRLAPLRAIAAGDAAAAEIVVVSVHAAESLPEEVRSWLDLWSSESRRRSRVLLGLFEPLYRGVSSGIQSDLREIASRTHTEFLAYSEEAPDDF